MPNIFQLQPPCDLFAPQDGLSDWQTLTFQRATRTQTNAGEIVMSYAVIGNFLGELQPQPAGLARVIHGIVLEVAYRFFVDGAPDIEELDRVVLDEGDQLEVVTTAQWGEEHCEVDLKHIGR